jgi:phosphate-selective porin OprO/OprP
VQAEGRLLHLAASLADADTNGDTIRLRARPQADLAVVRLADAGTMRDADRLRTVGVEGAWVHGPFKVQAEWLHGDVDRYGGSPDFGADAGYVSAVWNVTGETWTYKAGTIATAAPASPAAGLWQLGLRHDRVDLDDGTVAGGTMSAWTAGVNWYWRRHVRLSLNHVRVESERAGVDDDPSIVEARVQLHW